MVSILPTSFLGFVLESDCHHECVGEQSSSFIIWKGLCKVG